MQNRAYFPNAIGRSTYLIITIYVVLYTSVVLILSRCYIMFITNYDTSRGFVFVSLEIAVSMVPNYSDAKICMIIL